MSDNARLEAPSELTRLVDALEERYPGVHELEATYKLLRRRSETPRKIERAVRSQQKGIGSTTAG